MSRVYHQLPGCSEWSAARISAPLEIPGGLREGLASGTGDSATLLPLAGGGVALLSKPGSAVHVNGDPVKAGLRLLADRDEIRIATDRIYVTTRDLLEVENLPVAPVSCPRCSGRIDSGSPAVRCHCGAWFHQSAELPCFTYGGTCPHCGAATELDTDPWDPSAI